MNFYSLFVVIFILLILIYLEIFVLKNVRTRIFAGIIGLLLILFILMFPLIDGVNFASRITITILYVLQTIGLNQDIDIVKNLTIVSIYQWVYVAFIYIAFLLIPLMTATFLLSLVDSFVSRVRIFFSRKRKVIIFSSINERCLTIASKVNCNKDMIIFSNYDKNSTSEDELNKISDFKGIKISSNVSNIKLKKVFGEVYFYLFSSDMTQNLDNAIKLIRKYKDSSFKIWIYVLSNSEVDGAVLDSMDKGNICLDIVNEPERVTYQLLYEKPLYLESLNNNISVLLQADDVMGFQFIKAVTWCGQMADYNLSLTIVGDQANEMEETLAVKCPELIKNYNYKFINGDLYSKEVMKEISKLKDINYIILATSSDEKNILDGMFLRTYFERIDIDDYDRKPVINVLVKNNLLSEQIKNIKNEKNNDYDLNVFGSIKDIYYDNFIIDSSLENLTKEVHLSYDKSNDSREEKLKRFYQKEYYIKSSRATALHLNYKIYSILKDEYTDDKAKNLELFALKMKDKKVFDKLVRNEHDRWMAYTRANGYVFVSDNNVKKYQKRLNSHVHHLAKMHPCLTDFDNLERVGKSVGKEDLKTLDGDIILKIVEIMKK